MRWYKAGLTHWDCGRKPIFSARPLISARRLVLQGLKPRRSALPRWVSQAAWCTITNVFVGTFSHVRVDHAHSHSWVGTGIAQESVLPLLLFNLLVNSVAADIRRCCRGVRLHYTWSLRFACQLDADELVILVDSEADLQLGLDANTNWGGKCRYIFGISPHKSTVMVFGPSRQVPTCSVTLDGIDLSVVRTYWYLGVILTHVNHLTARGLGCFHKTQLDRAAKISQSPSVVSYSESPSTLSVFDMSLRRWCRHLLRWAAGTPNAFVLSELGLFDSSCPWHLGTLVLASAACGWPLCAPHCPFWLLIFGLHFEPHDLWPWLWPANSRWRGLARHGHDRCPWSTYRHRGDASGCSFWGSALGTLPHCVASCTAFDDLRRQWCVAAGVHVRDALSRPIRGSLTRYIASTAPHHPNIHCLRDSRVCARWRSTGFFNVSLRGWFAFRMHLNQTWSCQGDCLSCSPWGERFQQDVDRGITLEHYGQVYRLWSPMVEHSKACNTMAIPLGVLSPRPWLWRRTRVIVFLPIVIWTGTCTHALLPVRGRARWRYACALIWSGLVWGCQWPFTEDSDRAVASMLHLLLYCVTRQCTSALVQHVRRLRWTWFATWAVIS